MTADNRIHALRDEHTIWKENATEHHFQHYWFRTVDAIATKARFADDAWSPFPGRDSQVDPIFDPMNSFTPDAMGIEGNVEFRRDDESERRPYTLRLVLLDNVHWRVSMAPGSNAQSHFEVIGYVNPGSREHVVSETFLRSFWEFITRT